MVTGMSLKNKLLLPGFLMSFVGLSILIVILVSFLKESSMIKASRDNKDK
jgi:UPF0716 family protein affecting phage T7 exclusion